MPRTVGVTSEDVRSVSQTPSAIPVQGRGEVCDRCRPLIKGQTRYPPPGPGSGPIGTPISRPRVKYKKPPALFASSNRRSQSCQTLTHSGGRARFLNNGYGPSRACDPFGSSAGRLCRRALAAVLPQRNVGTAEVSTCCSQTGGLSLRTSTPQLAHPADDPVICRRGGGRSASTQTTGSCPV